MEDWIKEPPYLANENSEIKIAPMNMRIAVGFGVAQVTKDNEVIYSENAHKWSEPTLRKFENGAAKDPNHDWRVLLYAPLYEQEYQRQGDKRWVLIRVGMGFA